MAYIGRQLARGENKLFDDISSSFNGSTTVFNLTVSSVATSTATPYQLFVSLGGVMQKPNTDFTTAGNQITFTTAPAAGLSCWIMMQGDTIDQAAIPDASVTPSKISGSNFAFSGDLRLKDADGSHYVGFASPTTVAANKVWTLPAADGTASQYLQTNGSGVLTWSTVSIGGATGIDFNDNVKARFGTGNDLEIFHSGANKIVSNNSMTMYIGADQTQITNAGITEACAKFIADGAVELYHNNVKKIETSAAGVSITGALTVSTNATITGNLTVSGTTTTVDSVTLSVKDKNIEMGVVSSPSDTTADGGGITLKGATDKTFNWVDSTDAWTSSEHIHLGDNKNLIFGTGSDFKIHHHSSGYTSIQNAAGAGTLYLQADGNVHITDTNNDETFAKFIDNGAVELYHNNAKKIETTSGGINVTGAINVNGAALASGNTFTAVANGSIANNKAVKTDSDGKVSEIKLVTTAVTGAPPNARANETDSNNTQRFRNSWNENQSKMVLVTQRPSGNLGAAVATIGTSLTSSTFTTGTRAVVCSTPGDFFHVGYDPNTYKHLFVYNDTSKTNDKFCARLGTISGTSISFGTQVDLYSSNDEGYDPKVLYDDSNDKFIVVYMNHDGKLSAVVGTVSGTDISFSSPVVSTGTHSLQSYKLASAFDTDQNKVLSVFRNLSNSNNLDYCVGSISGGSFSWGTLAQLSSSEPDFIDIAFGATHNKFMIVFRETGNNEGRVFVAKIDSGATTASAGSEYYLRSAETTSARNLKGKAIAWDSTSNIFGFLSVNTTLSNERSFISYITTNSGDLLLTQQGATAFENVTYSDNINSIAIESMGSHSAFVTAGKRNSDGYPRYNVVNASVAASSLTSASGYVGFADQAYTNGQTATIKTYGNHVDTLSGLTVGTNYFVRQDGTVGTSSNFTSGFASGTPYAGVAISSSKLIIQHPSIMQGL